MNNLLALHGLIGGGDRATSGKTPIPKDIAKQLAQMQMLADKTEQDFEGGNVYYDSFDGTNKNSLGHIDLTSFVITTNTANIVHTNDKESLNKLKKGQEVSLVNGSNLVRVIIETIGEDYFTTTTSLTVGLFNEGIACRSMAKVEDGELIPYPSEAPEYDIRYKITLKDKQPTRLNTWVKYENPTVAEQYDISVTKVTPTKKYYPTVENVIGVLDEENFSLDLTFNSPKEVTEATLLIGYDRVPTLTDYDVIDTFIPTVGTATKKVNLAKLTEKIHYRFIVKYANGEVNDSLTASGYIELKDAYEYVVRINRGVSNPNLAVEYIGKSSEITDWESVPPFNQIRPVILDEAGTVVSEVDKNDFSKNIDGSSIDANLDLMIEFPKLYWKTETTDSYIDIYVSNKKIYPTMRAYAHTVEDEIVRDKLYVGAYRAGVSSGKLFSRYNMSASSGNGTSLANFYSYAQNKSIRHGVLTWNIMSLIKILFILRFKTLNSQATVGAGYYGSSGSHASSTGGMNTDSKATYSYHMKLFGISDVWGSGNNLLNGAYYKANNFTILQNNLELTSESATDVETKELNIPNTKHTLLTDVVGDGSHIFSPKTTSSTQYTQYFCDSTKIYNNTGTWILNLSYSEGNSNANDWTGLFQFTANFGVNESSGSISYSRLIYL